MKSDIQIAQEAKPVPIEMIAAKLNIPKESLTLYGNHKAKLTQDALKPTGKKGKLILTTAIHPTPAGEGKTTVAIGLADGLSKIGKQSIATLREPSLGPVLGMKGGATGGGHAQVLPMEEINLHFTGDLHAITTANNLLAALIDNHLQQGNHLGIDPRRITFKRCLDMNDRQLRFITTGLGGKPNGVPHEDGFDITAASEVMATLCMAGDIEDLKERLGNIIVGYSYGNEIIRARDLGAQGAMAALLHDAIRPNLVQTLEGTPALMHGGPFANIAHGCNSVIATKAALGLGDYVVTEAGFGADLGAEKFLDIKCRAAGLKPDVVVLVATVRALKYHGGAKRENLSQQDLPALETGLANLEAHISNMQKVYHLPVVVALNCFITDTEEELAMVRSLCASLGVEVELCESWEKGGAGATALAETVVRLAECENEFQYAYPLDIPLREKVETIASRIYHAGEVTYAPGVLTKFKQYEAMGAFPVCIAKTQYSFSDNPKLLGRPEGFVLHIRDAKLSAGAGFVVAYAGNIITMPGLPKAPAANGIDINNDGVLSGLF